MAATGQVLFFFFFPNTSLLQQKNVNSAHTPPSMVEVRRCRMGVVLFLCMSVGGLQFCKDIFILTIMHCGINEAVHGDLQKRMFLAGQYPLIALSRQF